MKNILNLKDTLSIEEKEAVRLRVRTALRDIRELNKWSQYDLAQKLSVHPSSINQMESGARLPSFEHIVLLSRFLNVSPNFIFGYQDITYPMELARRVEQLTTEQKQVILNMIEVLENT